MTGSAHRYRLLALATAVATLGACSSSGAASRGDGATVAAPSPSATPAPAAAHTAHAGGRAVVRVTGAVSITATGTGAVCNYFYPATKQGVAYSVSSAALGSGTGSAGGWDLLVSDDTGSRISVVLNTGSGSFTGGRSIVGTVHADPHLHHADFDVQLVKVVGQQHARLTGSIDCP
jgi:hypothetical protein